MAHLEIELNGMDKEVREAYKAKRAALTLSAVERLRDFGRNPGAQTNPLEVSRIIATVTGKPERDRDIVSYLQAFLDGDLDRGQIAPSRSPTPFKELDIGKKMPGLQRNFARASQHQGPMYTPNGYGDHAISWGGREGK